MWHFLVPSNYKDKQLAAWVSIQRQVYKKRRLSQDKIYQLNAIGFELSVS